MSDVAISAKDQRTNIWTIVCWPRYILFWLKKSRLMLRNLKRKTHPKNKPQRRRKQTSSKSQVQYAPQNEKAAVENAPPVEILKQLFSGNRSRRLNLVRKLLTLREVIPITILDIAPLKIFDICPKAN